MGLNVKRPISECKEIWVSLYLDMGIFVFRYGSFSARTNLTTGTAVMGMGLKIPVRVCAIATQDFDYSAEKGVTTFSHPFYL